MNPSQQQAQQPEQQKQGRDILQILKSKRSKREAQWKAAKAEDERQLHEHNLKNVPSRQHEQHIPSSTESPRQADIRNNLEFLLNIEDDMLSFYANEKQRQHKDQATRIGKVRTLSLESEVSLSDMRVENSWLSTERPQKVSSLPITPY
jgi:hypothetical protein